MGGRHELNCRNRAHNQIWRDKKAEFFHHFQPDKNKICFTSLALWTLERVAPVVAPSKIWRDKSQTSHRPVGSEWSSDYDRQWLAVTATWPSESSWKRTPQKKKTGSILEEGHMCTLPSKQWQPSYSLTTTDPTPSRGTFKGDTVRHGWICCRPQEAEIE